MVNLKIMYQNYMLSSQLKIPIFLEKSLLYIKAYVMLKRQNVQRLFIQWIIIRIFYLIVAHIINEYVYSAILHFIFYSY